MPASLAAQLGDSAILSVTANDCVNSHNALLFCAGELTEHKPGKVHTGNLASLPQLESIGVHI